MVSQAFNSDVGVDNDPISFNGGYVWYDVVGITPSRERTLDEVKDQVEVKWRDEQIAWLEKELQTSGSDWKIAVFHHPLYSSGERHGSDMKLRDVLEPLFIKYNVSLVLTGHDHFYERVKPQKGIGYFVVGSGGQLRAGNIDSSTELTAGGFDSDLVFLAAEIAGDDMYFNAVSRQGAIVDSGVLTRRKANGAAGKPE